MSANYFTQPFGVLQLLRLFCLTVFVTFTEFKLSSCNSYLSEFLGFNQQSILFYYILLRIASVFEVYFLVNRLFGTRYVQAKRSVFVLYLLLSVAFLIASCFTLYAIVHSSHGHVITQPDLADAPQRAIPASADCNLLRLVGIVFGFLVSSLYFFATLLVSRAND